LIILHPLASQLLGTRAYHPSTYNDKIFPAHFGVIVVVIAIICSYLVIMLGHSIQFRFTFTEHTYCTLNTLKW